ncbi:hypothetical protein M409DRAFT_51292 [Zasmidium cellare ATCC 36951]|uniref:Heterokaryon incompatibility domain-containing protein n=1 Tax=Zasmidium cellare ATCC 36951 TaxID=1080233 RepID=A0A6A6D096_ZASCE|nr:uncharacterized protein M409DRAFT_51292 [Zasmidium cellare ATCC 36951]KAF2171066.1 hypothetical protein M409DRAFT_51292 [Zasmidium cellare ATCC 36951]
MADKNPFSQLFQKNTVRLATLEPGRGDDVVKVKIVDINPRDASYDCISYDRSKDFDTVDVEVDGEPFKISKPLASALKAFRKFDSTRTVWADLLIGSNVEERSTQAREMKTVFEHADKTTAWLSSGNAQREAALDMIQTLANEWSQARLHANYPEVHSRATFQQMRDAQAYIGARHERFQPTNKALWEAVQRLFCTTYFETPQSIPEIILSKKPMVAVGDKSVSWPDFASASTAFAMLMPSLGLTPDPKLLKSLERIMGLQTATRRKRDGESLELLPMIKDARGTSYRDPREVVFSVIPISTPCLRTEKDSKRPALPEVDYEASEVEVFKRASRYILEDRQDLMMWWYERPPCGRKLAGLPSWAIDWSSPNINTGSALISPDNGLRSWADPLKNKRIYVDDEDGLHLQAHPLDRISSVSQIFTETNYRRLCLEEFQKLAPSREAATPEQCMDKYARTLILNIAGFGDTMRTSSAPSEDVIRSFQSLLAEERILQVLGCTMEQLMSMSPERIAEARAKPEIQNLAGIPGQSQDFDSLLQTNTLGRRFFTCESGRYGMTTIETPPEGSQAPNATPVPNFDSVLGDPLGQGMMSAFQSFLAQKDPRAAAALNQAIAGTMPGQRVPGVRIGDLVVAVIGGFQPYVLRAKKREEGGERDLNEQTKYVFVGDCYLHGVMDGECFKEGGQVRRDVRTVDVTVV